MNLRLYNTCDHKIFDRELPITGTYPNYVGLLEVPCDGIKENMLIRSVDNPDTRITDFTIASDRLQILFSNDLSIVEGQVPAKRYLVDYQTKIQECPRCQGESLIGDIAVDVTGYSKVISGKDKLKQQVIKMLLTEKGNNIQLPEYGSELNTLVGGNLDQYAIVLLQKYITDTLTFLANAQLGLDIEDSEKYLGIDALELVRDRLDITKVNVILTILNKEYTKIPIILTAEI